MSNHGFITQFFHKYKCTDNPHMRQSKPVLMTRLRQTHASLNRQCSLYVGPASAPINPKQSYCLQLFYQLGLCSHISISLESNAAAYLLLKEEHRTVFKGNSTGMTPRKRRI